MSKIRKIDEWSELFPDRLKNSPESRSAISLDDLDRLPVRFFRFPVESALSAQDHPEEESRIINDLTFQSDHPSVK